MMRKSVGWLVFVFAALTTSVHGQAGRGFEVIGPTFFSIQTADVEAAATWYERVLGLRELSRAEAPDGRYSIRLLSDAHLTVELVTSTSATDPPDVHRGLFKVGFYVDDIRATHRWVLQQGATADRSVFADETLQALSFVFRDLDGNRLQAFQACELPCS